MDFYFWAFNFSYLVFDTIQTAGICVTYDAWLIKTDINTTKMKEIA